MSIDKADSLPTLVGNGKMPACSEIHVFVGAPTTCPSDQYYVDLVAKYKRAVDLWNSKPLEGTEKMKAPVLTLIFRSGTNQGTDQGRLQETPITVCQSAQYIKSNHMSRVLDVATQAKRHFEDQGLDVIRLKVEASAYGIQGIPQTADQAREYPHLYFEFHIKVQRTENGEPQVITAEEEQELRSIANQLSKQLGIPIPLSYNLEKNEGNLDNGGCQRFLNARFYMKGMQEIKPILESITAGIEAKGYKVIKTISEYVWFDNNKDLDGGWIEYSAEELTMLEKVL